jgi:hypothetical protein
MGGLDSPSTAKAHPTLDHGFSDSILLLHLSELADRCDIVHEGIAASAPPLVCLNFRTVAPNTVVVPMLS